MRVVGHGLRDELFVGGVPYAGPIGCHRTHSAAWLSEARAHVWAGFEGLADPTTRSCEGPGCE